MFAGLALSLLPGFCHAEDSDLHILLVSGQMNQYHNADLMDRVITHYLEETGLFTVTRVKTPAAGEDMSAFAPDFSDYDAVVLNYDGDDWSAATQAAFEQYMREGGGLVSVHSSDNAFPHWQAFLDMTALGGWGGRDETWGPAVRWRDGQVVLYDGPGAASHPPKHDYLVTVRDFNHPVTEGLPESWLHPHDELYTQLRGPAQNMQLLATGFANPEMEGASGENEPVLFTVSYGAGRVFHTTLGHIGKDEIEAPASVRCVGFISTFQRGTEWAASGVVTLDVPADFPTANAVSTRP